MSSRGVVDTGPLVAFINRSDGFHPWAAEALGRFEPPLHSCEAVISEAWHLLGRARGGRDALRSLLSARLVVVTVGLVSESRRVFELLAKYADQPMSVADACLVRMAELDKGATLVTLDRDFLVYRRGRSALRILAPFQ